MADPSLMFVRKPLSLKHLSEVFGGGPPSRAAFMQQLMIWDYAVERHEFITAIETAHWTAVTSGGTDFAYNAQRGGALRGATGATGNNTVALHKAQTYLDAADNPVFMGRLVMPSSLANTRLEIGMSDPKTTETAQSVTDIDTPALANGVTDGAYIAMDTGQTLTTMALVAAGTSSADAKTNITDTNGTAHTPTASGIWEFVIGCREGQAMCMIWNNGAFIAHTVVNSGPDAGVLMRPSIYVETLAASSRVLDIDWLVIAHERNRTS